jgi:hypothetical protein
MRLSAAVLVMTMGGLALSCASTPLPPLPEAALAQLQPGTTTMDDARKLLGEPVATETHADGTSSWIYHYAPAPIPSEAGPPPTGSRRKPDVLRLVWKPTGVLATHEITHVLVTTEEEGERAAPPAFISP